MHIRRRGKALSEAPVHVKETVNDLTKLPFSQLGPALEVFEWRFGKTDLLHWADLLDYFDDLLSEYVSAFPELKLQGSSKAGKDLPCTSGCLLRVLHVSRMILDNSGNKHLYASSEHLTWLLASPEWEVALAALRTLNSATRRSTPSSRHLKLTDHETTSRLGCILHGIDGLLEAARRASLEHRASQMSNFEYYETKRGSGGTRNLTLPTLKRENEILERVLHTCEQEDVPPQFRFNLLWRARLKYMIFQQRSHGEIVNSQLLALSTLLQCCPEQEQLGNFFHSNADCVRELLALSADESAPLRTATLSVKVLTAMSCDRIQHMQRFMSVVSGSSYRGYLGRLCKRGINMVASGEQVNVEEQCFAEAVFQLQGSLVSSHSGATLLGQSGLPDMLLPVVHNGRRKHSSLVSLVVRTLEAFFERRGPNQNDSNGLVKTAILGRLHSEVQSLTQDALPEFELYNRRLLVKSLLRASAVILQTNQESNNDLEEEYSNIPHSLKPIFDNARTFGGNVFSHAANLFTEMLNNWPTSYPRFEEAGVSDSFLDSIRKEIPPTPDAILSIPNTLSAICLNQNGKQKVLDRESVKTLENVLVRDEYGKCLMSGETSSILGGTLDEFMRHVPEVKDQGLKMLKDSAARISYLDNNLDERVSNFARVFESVISNADSAERFVQAGGLEEYFSFFTLPNLCNQARQRTSGLDPVMHTLSTSLRGLTNSQTSVIASRVAKALTETLDQVLTLDLRTSVQHWDQESLKSSARWLVGSEGLVLVMQAVIRSSSQMLIQLFDEQGVDLFYRLHKVVIRAIMQLSLWDDSSKTSRQGHSAQVEQANNNEAQAQAHALVEGDTRYAQESYHSGEATSSQQDSQMALPSSLKESLSTFVATVRGLDSAIIKTASLAARRENEPLLHSTSANLCRKMAAYMNERLDAYAEELSFPARAKYLQQCLQDMQELLYDQRRGSCQTLLLNAMSREGVVEKLFGIARTLLQGVVKSDGLEVDGQIVQAAEQAFAILQCLANSHLLIGSSGAVFHLMMPMDGTARPFSLEDQAPHDAAKTFMENLQSRILAVVLPYWRQPACYYASTTLAQRLIGTLTCILAGVSGAPRSMRAYDMGEPDSHAGVNQVFAATITEMGFSRRAAERALRSVGNESVEEAMDWLLAHPDVMEEEAVGVGENEAEMENSNQVSNDAEKAANESNQEQQADPEQKASLPSVSALLDGFCDVLQDNPDSLLPYIRDATKCLIRKDDGKNKEAVASYLCERIESRTSGGGNDSLLFFAANLLLLVVKEEQQLSDLVLRANVDERIMDIFQHSPEEDLVNKKWTPVLLFLWHELIRSRYSRERTMSIEALEKQLSADHKDEGTTGWDGAEEEKKYGALESCTRVVKGLLSVSPTAESVFVDTLEAALHLIAHLTADYHLAESFVGLGGVNYLLNLPLFFFNVREERLRLLEQLIANVVRHTLEDESVLQHAMEAEIRGLIPSHGSLGPTVRSFLHSTISIAARSPRVFLNTVASLCKLDEGYRISLRPETKEKGSRFKLPHRPSSTFTRVVEILLEHGVHELASTAKKGVHSQVESPTGMEVDPESQSGVASMPKLWVLRKATQLRVFTDACAMYPAAAAVAMKMDQKMRVVQTLMAVLSSAPDQEADEDSLRGAARSSLLALSLRSPEGRKRVASELSAAFPKTLAEPSVASEGGNHLASLLHALASSGRAAKVKGANQHHMQSSTDLLGCLHEARMASCIMKGIEGLDLNHPDNTSLLTLVLRGLELITRDHAEQSTDVAGSKDSRRRSEHTSGTHEGGTTGEDQHQEGDLWVEPESYYSNMVSAEDEEDEEPVREQREVEEDYRSEGGDGEEDEEEDDDDRVDEDDEDDEEEEEEDDDDDSESYGMQRDSMPGVQDDGMDHESPPRIAIDAEEGNGDEEEEEEDPEDDNQNEESEMSDFYEGLTNEGQSAPDNVGMELEPHYRFPEGEGVDSEAGSEENEFSPTEVFDGSRVPPEYDDDNIESPEAEQGAYVHPGDGLPFSVNPPTSVEAGISPEIVRIRYGSEAGRRQDMPRNGSRRRDSNNLLLGAPPSANEHPILSHAVRDEVQWGPLRSSGASDSLRNVLSSLIPGRREEAWHGSSARSLPIMRQPRDRDGGSQATRSSIWAIDAQNHLGSPMLSTLESALLRHISGRLEQGPEEEQRQSHEEQEHQADDDEEMADAGEGQRTEDNERDGHQQPGGQNQAAESEQREEMLLQPEEPTAMEAEEQHPSPAHHNAGETERPMHEQHTEQTDHATNEQADNQNADQQDEGAQASERQETSQQVGEPAPHELGGSQAIDPTFLAALPPELQAEVIATHGHGSGGTGSGGGVTALTGEDNIDPEFLAALPPDIQAEVVQQQQAARRAHEAVQRATREVDQLRPRDEIPDTGRGWMRAFYAGSRDSSGRHRARRGGAQQQEGDISQKDAEGPPLLDSKEVSVVLKLIKFTYFTQKSILAKVVFNLSSHPEQRTHVLKGIVHPLAKRLGSLHELPQEKAKDNHLQIRNLLECLSNLLSSHKRARETFFLLSTHSTSAEATRKGKMKVGERESKVKPLVHILVDMVRPARDSGVATSEIEQVLTVIDVCIKALNGESISKDTNTRVRRRQVVVDEAGDEHFVEGGHPEGAERGNYAQEGNDAQAGQQLGRQQSEIEQQGHGQNQTAAYNQPEWQKQAREVLGNLTTAQLERISSLIGAEDQTDTIYRKAGSVIRGIATAVETQKGPITRTLQKQCAKLADKARIELQNANHYEIEERWSSFQGGRAIMRLVKSAASVVNASAGGADKGELLNELNAALESVWVELGNSLDHFACFCENGQLPASAFCVVPVIEAYFEICSGDDDTGKQKAMGLWKFAEKHREVINALIRQNPELLETSLKPLLKFPRLVDFNNKRRYFKSRIRRLKDAYRGHALRVYVRRSNVLDDSYQQLHRKGSDEMKGRLSVHFQGEEGVDAGGLTREWFSIVSREIFNPQYALFTQCDPGGRTFQPNPNSSVNPEHLLYFRFVGRIVGKALWEDVQMDAYFTRSFYKHILRIPVSYEDIEAIDPDFYKNLQWVIENDITGVLELTFSTEAHFFDKEEIVDLKPNGRNIPVTEENKKEYVDLLCQYKMTNAIKDQINSFVQGFEELIPHELVSIFGPGELELLISGLPEIDIDDLQRNTEYHGYSPSSPVVQWFWEVARSLSQEDRARLLQFCTGTSKVPLDGFQYLQGISGPQKFQIHRASNYRGHLISAHTCFNQLDLPEYSSREELHQKLIFAIHEASEGFGFQ